MTRYLFLAGLAATLAAQAPGPLERQFVGRPARLLLDMPGDDSGIDIHPGNAEPVDAKEMQDRIQKYGAALRQGQPASVTLVKVKGNHIEFHLNGGGFTNGQLMTLPGYDSIHWGITNEERSLKYRISGTRDKQRRRRLESEYDSLRRRRVRPLRLQFEREQRALHGSRFNVWFSSDREARGVTAEALAVILRPYVELK